MASKKMILSVVVYITVYLLLIGASAVYTKHSYRKGGGSNYYCKLEDYWYNPTVQDVQFCRAEKRRYYTVLYRTLFKLALRDAKEVKLVCNHKNVTKQVRLYWKKYNLYLSAVDTRDEHLCVHSNLAVPFFAGKCLRVMLNNKPLCFRSSEKYLPAQKMLVEVTVSDVPVACSSQEKKCYTRYEATVSSGYFPSLIVVLVSYCAGEPLPHSTASFEEKCQSVQGDPTGTTFVYQWAQCYWWLLHDFFAHFISDNCTLYADGQTVWRSVHHRWYGCFADIHCVPERLKEKYPQLFLPVECSSLTKELEAFLSAEN